MADAMRQRLTPHEQLFLQALAAALTSPIPGPNQAMFLAIALDKLAEVDAGHRWLGPLCAAARGVQAYGSRIDPLRPEARAREDHGMALMDLRLKLADVFAWRTGLLQEAMAEAGDNVRGVA